VSCTSRGLYVRGLYVRGLSRSYKDGWARDVYAQARGKRLMHPLNVCAHLGSQRRHRTPIHFSAANLLERSYERTRAPACKARRGRPK
jgi:hypothetical protein